MGVTTGEAAPTNSVMVLPELFATQTFPVVRAAMLPTTNNNMLATSSVIACIFISDWRCSRSPLASPDERAPGGPWRWRYSPRFARPVYS